MAIHSLSAPTLISSLMPSGGGTLASGDTIELSGHDLIIDADAVSYPVTLTNAGTTAHLELRDGGRIKLNATLPTSICPWVDPDNPLPESNYTAGLTANASAEIQLAGAFGLGGGAASLPSESRAGNWWTKALRWNSTTSVTFEGDINLHAGDYLQAIPNGSFNRTKSVKVLSYDSLTKTATLENQPNNKADNQIVCRIGGGVCINSLSNSSLSIFSNRISFGTLTVLSQAANSNGATVFDNCSATGCFLLFSNITGDSYTSKLSDRSKLNITNVYAQSLSASNASFVDVGFCNFDTLLTQWITIVGQSTSVIFRGKIVASTSNCLPCGSAGTNNGLIMSIQSFVGTMSINVSANPFWFLQIGDVVYENTGTVTRVARSSFPVDTDLPDAFYFAPATASDVPWRYEDYWVRKGDTLRLSCRAMRGGDNGAARVAIGEMAVWVPTEGMPTLAEWVLDSGEPLVWRGGQIAWTNDTGEDRQVRVWSMGSGINGAYIRVWKSTGGQL